MNGASDVMAVLKSLAKQSRAARASRVFSPSMLVAPTVWVRPRQGPNLADLIRQPGTARAEGDSDPIDVLGSVYAATDGDPHTAWTAPQRVAQFRTPPNLTVKLPAAQEVGGLRLTPSTSTLPAHPKLVAIDLGDGPQVRRLTGDEAQTVSLRPKVTDTVKVSLLDWADVIDRTALGFDQIKPPGLAEITALDARGRPIAAADAARNRERLVRLPCGRGPIIAVAGQFIQTEIDTTVGALLDGDPIPAKACRPDPIALPSGQQELLISPGAAFVVDGVALVGPLGRQLPGAATDAVQTGTWSADHREVDVPASQASRILVVPESINPGWTAHTADGAELSPVTVNGWQQGWVVPAGTSGSITLSATATDNVGVTRVDFLVDGALVGSASAAPYTVSLDSTTLSNASHSLVAKAYDAAGNAGTSAAYTFSVSNGGGSMNETESNGSISSANTVGSNTTITGTMGSSTDKDYFKVALAASQSLKVDMTGPVGKDYDLYLVDASGTILASSEGSTATESVTYRNGTSARTVYIEVVAYSGSSTTLQYTLKISHP